jgi:hypothetical protein
MWRFLHAYLKSTVWDSFFKVVFEKSPEQGSLEPPQVCSTRPAYYLSFGASKISKTIETKK